jgi:hypothetical protein
MHSGIVVLDMNCVEGGPVTIDAQTVFSMITSNPFSSDWHSHEWKFDEDEGAVIIPRSDLFQPSESDAALNIALSGQRKCLQNVEVMQERTFFQKCKEPC